MLLGGLQVVDGWRMWSGLVTAPDGVEGSVELGSRPVTCIGVQIQSVDHQHCFKLKQSPTLRQS